MNSVIYKFSLVYIALTAVFLGYLGFIWAFMPTDHMARLGISAVELPGINTLKSIMGTGLIGMAGCCVMFLFNRKNWYRPLFLLTGVMLTVRLTSLFLDGFHPRMTIYAVLEFLILVLVYAAVRTEPTSNNHS